jgi:hypothetical protein
VSLAGFDSGPACIFTQAGPESLAGHPWASPENSASATECGSAYGRVLGLAHYSIPEPRSWSSKSGVCLLECHTLVAGGPLRQQQGMPKLSEETGPCFCCCKLCPDDKCNFVSRPSVDALMFTSWAILACCRHFLLCAGHAIVIMVLNSRWSASLHFYDAFCEVCVFKAVSQTLQLYFGERAQN